MSTTPILSHEGKVTAWKVNGKFSQESVAELRQVIKAGAVLPEKYNIAVIDYDVRYGQPSEDADIDHYPLKVGSFYGAPWVFVSHVTAGYKGPCPHGTLECLKLMGFKLTPDEERLVLTRPDGVKRIRLSFYK